MAVANSKQNQVSEFVSAERYQSVRTFTDRICETITSEDSVIQSMPDVSPTRWHLAHTTWFFETFVLAQFDSYKHFNDQFAYLFNSYYNSVGKQFPRLQRGLISRPGLSEVREYRAHVDYEIERLLKTGKLSDHLLSTLEVGLHHEQQHQELILTDIKHVLSCNPLYPAFQSTANTRAKFPPTGQTIGESWKSFDAGVYEFGATKGQFAFDNEFPRHKYYVHDFSIRNTPVSNGEFLTFMEAGGYSRPEFWLAAGWTAVQEHQWQAPMYWLRQPENQWHEFTLSGLIPLDPDQPVCHLSYFEADAFARWASYRLPTEFEWELTASEHEPSHNFADLLLSQDAPLQPQANDQDSIFGNVWQWTSSQYTAYPGYRPPEGAIGEYNGKFMCNQFVLRGGSCATSSSHVRTTYRNFFPPEARWQFSGLRLAR